MKIFNAKLIIISVMLPLLIATGNVCPGAELPEFKFNHLTIKDGLSQSTVTSIIQDSRGLMWFGTGDGLNRYDGYNFKIFGPRAGEPGSLSDNVVNVIFEDRDRVLWVGTRNGLNKFLRESETFLFFGKNQGLSGDNVIAISQDKEGHLWLGFNNGGIARFNPAGNKIVPYKSVVNSTGSLSGNQVTSVFADSEGIVWVGTLNSGLNRFEPKTGSFIRYRYSAGNPNMLSNDGVTSIVEGPDGHIWVGTQNGLNRLDVGTGVFKHYKNKPHQGDSLSNNFITCLHVSAGGTFMVGTEKGLNLYKSDDQTFKRFLYDPNNPTSLANDIVTVIFEDPFQVLWVGTEGGGVSNYAPGRYKFKVHRPNPKSPASTLRGKWVYSFCEDGSGNLWVGTNEGLNRFNPRTRDFYFIGVNPGDPRSLNTDYVTAICEDPDGDIWAAVYAGGLNRLNSKTGIFKRYLHDENNLSSLSHNIVRVIYLDQRKILWLGTWGGGLNRFQWETGRFLHYQNVPGNETSISDNFITAITEDGSGNLWVGTDTAGLNLFDRDSGQSIRFRAPEQNDEGVDTGNSGATISNDGISSLLSSSEGGIWIGTQGGGLNYYDPVKRTFIYYKTQDGLANDTVWGILEDDDGNPWVSTNNGLSRLDRRTRQFRTYFARDGLQSNEFNMGACLKTRDGNLAFGGIEGFNLFDPSGIAKNQHVPPVIITGFKLTNKPVPIGPDSPLVKAIGEVKEIRLSYKDYWFSFEFAALDYYYPEANQYAYTMEGLDKDWIQGGTHRFATYTTLDPGLYTFRVRGSNNDGVWNQEGTSLRIIISPPFWMTWWFRGVAVSFLVLMVLVLFRVRTRSMRKRTRQLEEINLEMQRQMYERRQAEENLKRSERRLRTFLQTASEGFLEVDNDGFIMDVNLEMCDILGRPRDKIVGSYIFDFVNTEGVDTVSLHMKMRQKGQSSAYELTMLQPDHTEVHCLVNAAPVFDDNKEVKGSFALVTDITDIVKAEEELTRTKNYLKDVIDSLSAMLVTIDRNAVVTQWNRGAEKMFDIKEEDALSRSIWKVAPFLRTYRRQVNDVLSLRKPVELHRESIELYPGHKMYVDIYMYPLVYTALEGVVILVDDVTEFERKDQQLIQAQKMEIVGNLAGGLAHDFNNILGGIVGSTSLIQFILESGKIEVDDLKNRVQTIEESAERAVDLVKQLLTLSRKNEPAFSPVDMNIALRHVKKICENTFDKSIELDIISYEDDALVWADATQLEQVLLNLCINASHAMTIMRGEGQKRGGTLSVRITTIEPDLAFREHHPQATEEYYWKIEVMDDGVGMESDILSKIFDPFFTTKSERKGTGLGLAMVYYIVQQHKGFISVYSEPGLGTTFSVYLPRVMDTPAPEPQPQTRESLVHGNGMVLMIDDEEHLRITTTEILKSCGYTVITACDGIEGIETYTSRGDDIDMVLLDMAMPIMSGKEVYIKLRKINPNIKVLLTSGFKEDERVRQVLKLGVNGFIQKPFSMVDLSKRVYEVINSDR